MVRLPKITDEIIDDYYPWLIADTKDGLEWNQAAVDFACLIQAEEKMSTKEISVG